MTGARARPPGSPRVLLEGLGPGAVASATAVVHLVGGEVVGPAPTHPTVGSTGASDPHGVPDPGGVAGAGGAGGEGRVDGDAGGHLCVDLVLAGDPTRAAPSRPWSPGAGGLGHPDGEGRGGDVFPSPRVSPPPRASLSPRVSRSARASLPPPGAASRGSCGSSAVPRVVIGERGTLRLPGDEDLLADLVRAVALGTAGQAGCADCRTGDVRTVGAPVPASTVPTPSSRPGMVVGVAGWQGGVGTTTFVRALARRVGAVVVDATGVGPGVVAPGEEDIPGVRWADLRDTEPGLHPDLVLRLPVIGTGPALVADHRGGATPGDPRLPAVLRHLSSRGDVVVDLGRWDARVAQLSGAPVAAEAGSPGVASGAVVGAHRGVGGVLDVVCLVGRGDDASAAHLAGAVGVWPPGCPVVVVHTNRSPSSLLGEAMAGRAPTPGAGRGGGRPNAQVTWRFGGRRGARVSRRRLTLLWTRLRRLVPGDLAAGRDGP